MGVLSLIERAGGEIKILEQIEEQKQLGNITRKQAHDLRQAIKEACQTKKGLIIENEAIKELDKKIKEAVMFYR